MNYSKSMFEVILVKFKHKVGMLKWKTAKIDKNLTVIQPISDFFFCATKLIIDIFKTIIKKQIY